MMKRYLLLLAIMLAAASIHASANSTHQFSRPLMIQGARGAALTLDVTPIASQSEGYRIGMPFSIEDVQVQSTNKTTGRTLAYWSLIANTEFSIDVEARLMRHIDHEEVTLPYRMTFVSDVSLANGNSEEVTFYFDLGSKSDPCGISLQSAPDPKVTKNADSTLYSFDFLSGLDTGLGEGKFIGSLNGSIDFKFSDSVTTAELADDDAYPVGQYQAEVVITLKEKN